MQQRDLPKVCLISKPSHSFDKCLWSSYHKPGAVAGTRDTMAGLGEKLIDKSMTS